MPGLTARSSSPGGMLNHCQVRLAAVCLLRRGLTQQRAFSAVARPRLTLSLSHTSHYTFTALPAQVLAGFVAAGAALLAAPKAQAVTPVDLFDDRKARDTGFDIIYEARDLDLPQNVRDGLTQVRLVVSGCLRVLYCGMCVGSARWRERKGPEIRGDNGWG